MSYIESLVAKCSSKEIILDTNLLIVLLVGVYSKDYISQFKKTSAYSAEDYDLLVNIIKYFPGIMVTPHILSELSNLTFHQGIDGAQFDNYLAGVVKTLNDVKEHYIEKEILLDSTHLPYLGFTDSSIVEIAKDTGNLILTDDLRLYGVLVEHGYDSLNINHIRSDIWLRA